VVVVVVSTAVVVVVSTAVVVFMGVSLVAVSTGEAFVVANSVQCEADTCSAAAVSTAAAFVVTVLVVFVAAVLVTVITDSIMMSSSSTTSAFRGGGAGAIRTDITVPTITRTITMGTAGTVTKATPVMDYVAPSDRRANGRDANKKTLTGLLMRTTVSEIFRPDRHAFFARVALSLPSRPAIKIRPAPLSTRRKSINERQRQRVCAIAAPSYEGVRITPRVAAQNPTHAQSRQGDSKR
jgi:hypothetical protein